MLFMISFQSFRISGHFAVAETNDARCVFEQSGIVSGEDEGETEAVVEATHEVDQLRGVACVQIGGGFVSQDQGRTMHDGAGNGHPLALATGEQVRAMMGAGGKSHTVEGGGHALHALLAANPLDKHVKPDAGR